MAEPDPLHRTLCCGATCGRGTPEAGPCVASTYGAAILCRLEAGGYTVTTDQGLTDAATEAFAGYLDHVAAHNRGIVRIILTDLASAVRTTGVEIR